MKLTYDQYRQMYKRANSLIDENPIGSFARLRYIGIALRILRAMGNDKIITR